MLKIFTDEENTKLTEILNKDKINRTNNEIAVLGNRIRQLALFMVYSANSGHPGGPLGLADIFAALFFKIMSYDKDNLLDSESDLLILSNGHVCAVRYAAMALAGFLPEDELVDFRKLGSRLQGHPSTRYFPEVVTSSGSLGQGLSQAAGIALGLKKQNKKGMVYVCISDGECQEGMTWEAAMSIAHRKQDNLIVFVDYNNIQIDGFVEDVMDVGSLRDKFESFGFHAITADGHDINSILTAFEEIQSAPKNPKVIVFNTVLGKDVSFMENQPGWHGKPPSEDQFEQAIKELKEIFLKLN